MAGARAVAVRMEKMRMWVSSGVVFDVLPLLLRHPRHL